MRRINGLKNHYPSHVSNCAHGKQRQRWFVHSWEGGADTIRQRPYVCNSWRCPHCQPNEARILHGRAMEAFSRQEGQKISFLVLTIPYSYSSTAEEALEMYSSLSGMFERFRKRVNRELEKRGMQPIGNRWISVVEAHQSGWPHMNVLIQGNDFASLLEEEERTQEKSKRGDFYLLHGLIARHARDCGFGRVSGNVQGDVRNALSYVIKTAKEWNKALQLPLMAEKRFRRVRSGKGFLPKSFRQQRQEARKLSTGSGGCLTVNDRPYKTRAPALVPFKKRLAETVSFASYVSFYEERGNKEILEFLKENIQEQKRKVELAETALAYASATCDDSDRVDECSYTRNLIGRELLKQQLRKAKRNYEDAQQNEGCRIRRAS